MAWSSKNVASVLAIARRCDTENIGVEKVALNLLANPRIRWLVICGTEAKGHRAGDAFLRLKERGVDADMRVLESASWRPILKNLTLLDVAQFRQQIEEVNLIGVTDIEALGLGKLLMALITLVSVSCGYWCLSRRFARGSTCIDNCCSPADDLAVRNDLGRSKAETTTPRK